MAVFKQSGLFSIKTISLVLLSLQTTSMVLVLRYSRTTQSHSNSKDDVDGASITMRYLISPAVIKTFSLFIVALETAAAITLIRYTRSSVAIASLDVRKEPSHLYMISTAVMLSEILKCGSSIFCLYIAQDYEFKSTKTALSREVFTNSPETYKMLVPAFLYMVQNNLLYLALTNLDVTSYQVTYQLRILFTAIFSWTMLGKRLSVTHWTALSFLMIGVALVQVDGSAKPQSVGAVNPHMSNDADVIHHIEDGALVGDKVAPLQNINIDQFEKSLSNGAGDSIMDNLNFNDNPQRFEMRKEDALKDFHKNKDNLLINPEPDLDSINLVNSVSLNREVSWLLGVLAVLISCVLSAFSGVYFEKVIKKSKQTSLIVRNIQLSSFSILFGLISLFNDRKQIMEEGYFSGYGWSTWVVVLLQAFGGLTVSVAMKYADNILKVFATSVSIILSMVISITLLDEAVPSIVFIIGTSIVIVATLMYGRAPSTDSRKGLNLSAEYSHKHHVSAA